MDAAISNPTVITPTHLLLRSNQASQTLSVTVTNTAPFSISYKLGHKPAAAITTKGLWFVGDQEDLLAQLAATVEIKQAGRVVDSLSLAPRRSATLEVRCLPAVPDVSCVRVCECVWLPPAPSERKGVLAHGC